MHKLELDVLGKCLLIEELVFIAHEGYHIRLSHAHHHLSLVNLTKVHHLVDKVQDTFRVLAHDVVDGLSAHILVLLDEREQWGENQRQRRSDLVADIHEEFQLRLAHLLGVDMFLQGEAVFLLALAVLHVGHAEAYEEEQVDELGPGAGVPYRVYGDAELLDWCLISIADGLEAEMIGACRQVEERNLIDARLHGAPFFAIDAIGVGYLLYIAVGQRAELQGEAVVFVREVELGCLVHTLFGNGVVARFHARYHVLVA